MGRYNEEWASQTCLNFIEASPLAMELARYEPYMRVVRFLRGTDDLCFHRSACIRRKPGENVVTWHTDASVKTDDEEPQHTGDILNSVKDYFSCSCWFYLTGSRPSHGGLYVVPDSNKDDWQPPAGYRLINNGKNFNRIGDPADKPYSGFEMPGMLPLITEPGDMLLFTRKTYHGAAANREEHTRLSCAVGFRPRAARIDAPWEWPESAHELQRCLPPRLKLIQIFHQIDSYGT
jgi:ectoine hydroxylase-related dioxygenase (phytanoyl-CoA dioxygenase family)